MPILLQINVVANSGSTGRIVEGIVETLINDNWNCYTAYGRWANPSKSHLYKIGNKYSVYSHYLISSLFDMHGLASTYATKRLISKIKEINPDLIHLHNIHGYYVNFPLLFHFLSQLKIPVVWTLHDCWAYTGHCVYYTRANCTKWINGCYNCPSLRDYPASLLCDHSWKNYNLKKQSFTSVKNLTLVAVSQWLVNEVKQSFLCHYPIKMIHNGIDTDVFRPVDVKAKLKYNVENRFLILGVAAGWNSRKGLSDFIKLSKQLSLDDVIILVGLNQEQISQLPSNIIGLKKTENIDELVELYSSADLFVNFSTEETFGLTTAESMACGTPVLVHNSTACPEIVTEDTGFVIELHNIDGVLRAIEHLKVVGKQYYSDNCRSYVLKNLKKGDKYKEYAVLYKELLQKGRYFHSF